MKKIIAVITVICICLLALTACTETGNTGSQSTALTKADYAAALGSMNQKCLELTSAGANAKLSVFEPLTANDYVTADRLDIIRACVWFVGFLENVCKNESFTLKDGFTECTATFQGETFNIRFSLNYNSENGRILTACYSYDIKRDVPMLLEFDINYNKETKQLLDFNLNAFLGDEDFYKFHYDGTKLYQLSEAAASYASFASEIITAANSHIAKAWGENLTDYSKEYGDACPYHMAD